MNTPLNIGIAGLGVVGATAAQILQKQADMIAGRTGREIKVVAVSSRDQSKDRGFDSSAMEWFADARDLAKSDNVDLVVEAIGGSEGIAKEVVEIALQQGKPVVTANKALLAEHGIALAELAEKHQVTLAYEAAVAGGIPVVKALREGLAANQIEKVVGILNGTSNFILTHMHHQGSEFEEALSEASRLGYAEADPSFDIDGIDAAHKLSILTALAFGCKPDFAKVHIEGIRHITKQDMQFAQELGYNIKLLGITQRGANGKIEQRVHPCMLPASSPIGVDDVYNAIVIEGDAVGRSTLEGRGAGGGPTASSVIADIMDIARGVTYPPYTLPLSQLEEVAFTPIDYLQSAYYLRLSVLDQPGVLSEVTRIFSENDISLCSFLQKSHQPEQAVQLVVTTHKTVEQNMRKACDAINALSAVTEKTHLIRIEDFGNE
jgi:homoserine dehydrogenase